MKIIYAKLWLRKFIKYNYKKENNSLSHELNRNVITLSHRVYKTRGKRGHDVRQKIRQELQNFVMVELKKYKKNWVIRSSGYGYIKSPSFLSRLKEWWFVRGDRDSH